MSKLKHRYVEVSYEVPNKDQTQFFAMLTETASPKEAAHEAVQECLRRHPDATEVEEFMQRAITLEKAQRIIGQMTTGAWSGWDFTREQSAQTT